MRAKFKSHHVVDDLTQLFHDKERTAAPKCKAGQMVTMFASFLFLLPALLDLLGHSPLVFLGIG